MTSRQLSMALAWSVVGLAMGSSALAQDQDQPKLDSREAVNTYYAKQFRSLEQTHIGALTKVAAGEEGEAADATYRILFDLAIARNLYTAAEPAAEQVLSKGTNDPQINAMAHLVNVIAEADKGQYDESLQHLEEFIKSRPKGELAANADPSIALTIGEAYFQRLVQAGRYDVAEKLCQFACENAAIPAVKARFADHLERLERLGQPAPALSAQTVDGSPLKLSDLKGKVVVVEFWATWCPPCSRRMYELNQLYAEHKDDGLVILGVNVDALREGAGEAAAVKSAVRRYLIEHQVAWPNLLNAEGAGDFVKAFDVEEVPVNFLIGRDGKIVGLELDGPALNSAVEKALGGEKK